MRGATRRARRAPRLTARTARPVALSRQGSTASTLSKASSGRTGVYPMASAADPPELPAPRKVPERRPYELFQIRGEAPPPEGAVPSPTEVFYRDVVFEGWLQKLPPSRNWSQGWKTRWFRLVIVISAGELDDGPVILEYLDKPGEDGVIKGKVDLSPVVRISRMAPDRSKVAKPARSSRIANRLLFVELPNRTYPLLAASPQDADKWTQQLTDTMGLDSQGSMQRKDSFSGFTQAESSLMEASCEAVVLNRNLPCRGEVKVALRGDQLSLEPLRFAATATSTVSWRVTSISAYGHTKHIVWLEIARGYAHAGVVCFSTPSAATLWEALNHNLFVIKGTAAGTKLRCSRNQQMSWRSYGGDVDAERQRVGSPVALVDAPDELFGEALGREDFRSAGVAIVREAYAPVGPGERELKDGEIVNLLACRLYLERGFWLGTSGGGSGKPREFFLVKDSCVELYDRGFAHLAEHGEGPGVEGDDDTLSLDEGDMAMYDYPDRAQQNAEAQAQRNMIYEEPVPMRLRGPSLDFSAGMGGGEDLLRPSALMQPSPHGAFAEVDESAAADEPEYVYQESVSISPSSSVHTTEGATSPTSISGGAVPVLRAQRGLPSVSAGDRPMLRASVSASEAPALRAKPQRATGADKHHEYVNDPPAGGKGGGDDHSYVNEDAAHDYINWEAAAANQDVAGAAPRKGLVRVAPTAGDRM